MKPVPGPATALFLFVLLAATITPAFSQPVSAPQTGQAKQEPEAQPAPAGFPVILDNKELFRVHSAYMGYSAEYRATDISRRIEGLARDLSIPPESIATADSEQGTQITAGGRLAISVLDGDVRAGKSRQALAKEYADILRKAIIQYRIDYSRKQIARGIALAVLLTLILLVAVRFVLGIHARSLDRLRERVTQRYGKILEDTSAQRALESILAVLNFIRFLLIAGMVLIYLQTVLGLLPWTRPFAHRVLEFVLVPLKNMAHGFIIQIPNLFFLAVLSALTYYLLKIIRIIFNLIELGRISIRGFEPEWSKPTFNIVRFLVIAFALVVAFPYLPGSESPAFKGISVFIGVLFSLGSSSAIASAVAGLGLTYRRAYHVGDRVQIGDVVGEVTAMRLTVTHLRSPKNELITIPNSQIVNSHVINFSSLAREHGLILHTAVTIGYDAPWRQVHAMLLMAAEKTPGILKEPIPFVLQRELQDFYIKYELNAYTDDPTSILKTYSILHQNIQDVFNEYGVQIMSPNYEDDPERPKMVPRDQWYAPPARKDE